MGSRLRGNDGGLIARINLNPPACERIINAQVASVLLHHVVGIVAATSKTETTQMTQSSQFSLLTQRRFGPFF
ncbi:MAG: hypothetical protein V7642_4021, partial [Burkholderiales bacterium]